MKRSWPIYLVIGGLALTVVVLGIFQYRWQVRLSEADSEKARERVQEQAERFASDFNREIQNAYFNFQTDVATWRDGDWAAFNERVDFWKSNTPYPGLIREFYYFDNDRSRAPLKYLATERRFEPVEENADLRAIRERTFDHAKFDPVDEQRLVLILPIHEIARSERIVVRIPPSEGVTHPRIPEARGHLAIMLDESTLKDGLLTDLKQKYFGDGEFQIAVSDSKNAAVYQQLPTDGRDATAALFDLAPDRAMLFANRDILKSIGAEKREAIINSKVETEELTGPVPHRSKTISLEMKAGRPRTSIFTATIRNPDQGHPWTLGVQHSAGSIDAFVSSTLWRNLAVGFGLLLLLAAAVASIVVYSLRARLLAERQLNFVSSVSHEFRTPLAVIYSAGENLADGVAKHPEQISRYGNLIKGEGKKLSAMVEQILEFAGARSGKRKFSFAPTKIDEVIDNALAECAPLINERDVTVEKSIGVPLPRVNADSAALSQTLQNLIANSIKYSNGDSWLRVSATNGGGTVKLVVEDKGIGISRSDIKQIFQPFFRSREVVDAQIHGNGLGLSLVKQVVDAHGGRVHVESEIGKGSKFTIEIPASTN
jgi:signal transduction histidine kinase